MYFYFNQFSVRPCFYDVPLYFNAHVYMYTCFRCARNRYIMQIHFAELLPRSKCYSSKTCLMCTICTFKSVRCSNGTMNNTSTLILFISMVNIFASLGVPLNSVSILVEVIFVLQSLAGFLVKCWTKKYGTDIIHLKTRVCLPLQHLFKDRSWQTRWTFMCWQERRSSEASYM